MQFLEWSVVGLRSARHVFKCSTREKSVTLFPMVHLGEAHFYEKVYDHAATHDVVVLEGVESPVARRLTRVYRWVRPSRLGLIVQPKFASGRVEAVRADLQAESFDALWRAAPWPERMVMEAGAGFMGAWLRWTATRASIGRRLNTSDNREREAILSWDARYAPMLHALLEARDEVLCQTVADLVADGNGPRTIAVIYGAGHMGVLAHALGKTGFRRIESDWMRVFGA